MQIVYGLVMAATLGGAALTFRWMARRIEAGTFGRNPMAGVRTKTTMASDEAWAAAHLAALPSIRRGGTAMAISAVICLLASAAPEDVAYPVITLTCTLGLLVGTVPLLAAMPKIQAAARAVETE